MEDVDIHESTNWKKNDVYTIGKCKIALNRYDDKKSVQADGIKTLAR